MPTFHITASQTIRRTYEIPGMDVEDAKRECNRLAVSGTLQERLVSETIDNRQEVSKVEESISDSQLPRWEE